MKKAEIASSLALLAMTPSKDSGFPHSAYIKRGIPKSLLTLAFPRKSLDFRN